MSEENKTSPNPGESQAPQSQQGGGRPPQGDRPQQGGRSYGGSSGGGRPSGGYGGGRPSGGYGGGRDGGGAGGPRVRKFRPRFGAGGRFRAKVCRFCTKQITEISYKDVEKLLRFTTERGKIMPRRLTGTCAKHQRMLTREIKIARLLALLPFVRE